MFWSCKTNILVLFCAQTCAYTLGKNFRTFSCESNIVWEILWVKFLCLKIFLLDSDITHIQVLRCMCVSKYTFNFCSLKSTTKIFSQQNPPIYGCSILYVHVYCNLPFVVTEIFSYSSCCTKIVAWKFISHEHFSHVKLLRLGSKAHVTCNTTIESLSCVDVCLCMHSKQCSIQSRIFRVHNKFRIGNIFIWYHPIRN